MATKVSNDKTTKKKPRNKDSLSFKAYIFFKRAFDILSSGLALIVLSPVLIIILLVKFLEDFHNPIYVSTRVGKDGKEFKFYKIRSMCPNAENMKQQLINSGMNEADGPVFKMKDDPRITKFGKFLRRTSLDELPQLWNVFKGDMSVVGPRSPLPKEVEDYTQRHMRRFEVKGGLLCLWQIQENRHDILFDDWVNYDIEYIENMSFALDMKIIFKGAMMILSGRSGD